MKKRRKNSNYGGPKTSTQENLEQSSSSALSIPLEMSYIPAKAPTGYEAFKVLQTLQARASKVMHKIDPMTLARVARGDEVCIDDFVINVDATKWRINLDHLVKAGMLTQEEADTMWTEDVHCRRTTNPGMHSAFDSDLLL